MYELRPYQKRAIEEIRQAIKDGFHSIMIQAPTGAGKGVILSHIINSANNKGSKVLFLVHRAEILFQISAYMDKYEITHGIIKAGFEADYTIPVQLASFQTIHRRMKFYQEEFDLVIIDECFPSGTMVDGIPIEKIIPGDYVLSFNTETMTVERRKVVRLFKNPAPKQMVVIRLSTGKTITCTANHPFYVDGQWIPAMMLESGCMVQHIMEVKNNEGTEIDVSYLSKASNRPEKKAFGVCQKGSGILLSRMYHGILSTGVVGNNGKDKQGSCFCKNESKKSNGVEVGCGKDENNEASQRNIERDELSTGRERESFSDTAIAGTGTGLGNGNSGFLGRAFSWVSDLLQGRRGKPSLESSYRGRWGQSSRRKSEAKRRKEGHKIEGIRVDCVEVHQSSSQYGSAKLCRDGFVYNIEVEGNHNYFAEGVLVHNCHHATAKTYHEVITAFRKKLILGFSATPTRQNGMGLGNVFDKLVSVATIQDLTDMGFLAPIRYFAPVQPDLSGVKLTAGDYNAKQLEPAMMDGHLIGDMLEHWLKYGEDRKTVIFATGVAHSIAIKDRFNAAEIPTCHIDGTTPKEDRDEVLSRFKRGDIKIIVNCQILTEGVDVPDVGCVVLARPTKSLVMYMQMVGRGMRVIEGKTDLILIDHAGACYEHGFVHEITEWELSETKQTTNKENEKRKKKESRPITCPMCSCTYSKRLKCPECGNIPERAQFGKEVDHIDGVLGEICFKSKAAKIKKVASSDKESWFSQLKTYAKHRGYSPGWAANTFREKFSVWPNKYKDAPLIPFDFISLEVLDYIKYKRIRLAKSKDKAHVSV